MESKLKVVRVDRNGDKMDLTDEREELKKVGVDLEGLNATTEEEIIAAAGDAGAIITGAVQITRRVMASLPGLKVVVRYGIGYDVIDVDAATDNGIVVVNIPDYCYEEVSNHAIALLLICAKKIIIQNDYMKQGLWDEARKVRPPMGPIYGQILGLIGTGNIGRMVARKAQVFSLKVLGYDPYADKKMAEESGITLVAMPELLSESDFVSVHCPLNKETHHLVSDNELSQMKKSAYLINTARGPIVDEAAVIRALEGKKIAGAAIDVFEKEPVSAGNPLLAMDNVVKMPHSAFYSDAAFKRLKVSVAREAGRVLSGHWPRNYVNKGVKPKVPLS